MVADESNFLPEDPGRTPTSGARPPPSAERTSTLVQAQRVGVGAYPSPLHRQRPGGAPPFGQTRVEKVGSSAGARAGGKPSGMGKIRLTEALSLEEDERQRRELQRAFGVSPEVGAPAQWHRATRDHWSLDAPSMVGGAGPSLHGVGDVAP